MNVKWKLGLISESIVYVWRRAGEEWDPAAFLQMLGEFSVHWRKYIDKAVVVVAMHSLW